MEEKSKRSRLDIAKDILLLCRAPRKKESILPKSDLDIGQLDRYLDFLISNSFLRLVLATDRESYMVTEKGKNFIEEYEGLVRSLTPTELELHVEG